MKKKKNGMSREEAFAVYKDLKASVISVLNKDVAPSAEQRGDDPRDSAAGTPTPLVLKQRSLIAMLGCVGALGATRAVLAVLSLGGVVESPYAHASTVNPGQVVQPQSGFNRTAGQERVFQALEAQRAELERRRVQLEDREDLLKEQQSEFEVRLAELRTLTNELRENRKVTTVAKANQVDHLSKVYVSMKPEESARLIEQLDPLIALELIKRMPEKRIGQLLSLMDPKTALSLTKLLTGEASDKKPNSKNESTTTLKGPAKNSDEGAIKEKK